MKDITTSRPNWIDYAKVFMIYLVVLGHYTYALGLVFKPSNVWNLMHIITLFHMPFFFVVSGLLYKCISLKETIKKGWTQLLRPYILMCLISCGIMVAIDLIKGSFSFKTCALLGIGVLSGNDSLYSTANWSSALWFCYSLFIVKVIVSCFQYIRYKIVIWGGYLILIIITIFVLYKGNISPFRIDSSLVGLFFFSIGYFLKDKIKEILRCKLPIRITFLLLAIVFLFIAGYFNMDFESKQGLSINACYFGRHPLLFLASGLSGTMTVLLIASFVSINSKRVKNIIMQISNGTIIILGFHWTIYKLCFYSWVSSNNVLTALCVAFAVIIVCYVIILLADKFWPALLGYRKIS